MPAKFIKMGGKIHTIKSVLLSNGNLLIPKREEGGKTETDWTEVEPGTSDFKRWFGLHEIESDPRESEEYKLWKKAKRHQ